VGRPQKVPAAAAAALEIATNLGRPDGREKMTPSVWDKNKKTIIKASRKCGRAASGRAGRKIHHSFMETDLSWRPARCKSTSWAHTAASP